jgi:CDP-diacylglycerol--serine O-phosphatidyltransferase
MKEYTVDKIGKWFPPLKHVNLPNLMSTSAVVAGFIALALTMGGKLRLALVAYPLALIIDNFDGMVARKLKLTSEFGGHLDTVADGFNFCFIPAAMAYSLGFSSASAVAVLILYLVAGVWRLAYYSMIGTQSSGTESYFIGFTTNLCSAIFYVLLTFFTVFPAVELRSFFYPFFTLAAVAMVSAVKTMKYGLSSRVLYVLIPLSMALAAFMR